MSLSDGSPGSRISYITFLSAGMVVERLITHLLGASAVVLGQPWTVLVVFFLFLLTLGIWLRTPRRSTASGLLLAFLLLMGIAWLAHFFLYRFHGDAFNYTAILYLPTLALIAAKPPTRAEARQASLAVAWAISATLVLTFTLERFNVIREKNQASGVVAFDENKYFLPLNALLGIEGRWPGPFGHNGDTAMMAALLVVIAFAFWSRASWLFIAVGTLALVLTNGRASIGAALAGIVIITLFGDQTWLSRFPRAIRVSIGSALLVTGAAILLLRPSGITGRDTIWPAFLELWIESPWLGVGGGGFAEGNSVTIAFGHAHSLYIEELARSGLIGFLTQFSAIAIGAVIAVKAAKFGHPGPLGVIVAFLVTGITEPRNNWIEPSATGTVLMLMILAASAYSKNALLPSGSSSAASADTHASDGSHGSLTERSGPD